jgi:hypothetical protein
VKVLPRVDGKVLVELVKSLLVTTCVPVVVNKVADDGIVVELTEVTLGSDVVVCVTKVAELGMVVPLIDEAVAAPMFGVTSVGVLANTAAPEPVSSVTAAAKLAELGVAKNVATPDPRPETPLEIGTLVMVLLEPEMVLLVSV